MQTDIKHTIIYTRGRYRNPELLAVLIVPSSSCFLSHISLHRVLYHHKHQQQAIIIIITHHSLPSFWSLSHACAAVRCSHPESSPLSTDSSPAAVCPCRPNTHILAYTRFDVFRVFFVFDYVLRNDCNREIYQTHAAVIAKVRHKRVFFFGGGEGGRSFC